MQNIVKITRNLLKIREQIIAMTVIIYIIKGLLSDELILMACQLSRVILCQEVRELHSFFV